MTFWKTDGRDNFSQQVVLFFEPGTLKIPPFAAIEDDLALACASALACFGIAAECAASKSSGPATFKEKMFDCVFLLDKKTIDKMQKVEG